MLIRKITDTLCEWKADPQHKPLIIKGPRQCGKTFSVLDFAKNNYKNIVYLNFFENQSYKARIRECFRSIPKQLAKENKKFQYSVIKKGSTASSFAGCLQWIGPLSIFRTLVLRKSFYVSGSLGCRFNNLSVVVFLILKRR